MELCVVQKRNKSREFGEVPSIHNVDIMPSDHRSVNMNLSDFCRKISRSELADLTGQLILLTIDRGDVYPSGQYDILAQWPSSFSNPWRGERL
jgi:hypothetical protein